MNLLAKKSLVFLLATTATIAATILCFFNNETNKASSSNFTSSSSSSSSSSRRQLSGGRKRLSQYSDPQSIQRKQTRSRETKQPNDVRYAAFGTSITWGSGIDGDPKTLAYPALLSPTSSNFAIRAAGPNYPSACAYSLVGDEIYDVFVLEFFGEIETYLDVLVRRLRERFPDAIIIILREWWPILIEDENGLDVRDFAVEHGFSIFDANNPEFHEAFLASDGEWFWGGFKADSRYRLQEEIAERYGAHILEMERPENPRDWVRFQHLIHNDFRHKSNAGHEEMARRVRNLVDRLGVPVNPRIGTWSNVDFCVNWFESGDYAGINVGDGVVLNNFSNRQGAKYALEFPYKMGYIEVFNPSRGKMKLYLTYMTTHPPPSKYPQVRVKIGNRFLFLEQTPQSNYGDSWVHVHRMQMVGSVPPGKSKLIFKEMEDGKWPFRLVSVALTNEDLIFQGNVLAKKGLQEV